ncbi:MAG TPA: hypothetical protein DCW72_08305 [Elusimicrobia bacterium]|nr:MAG: hypothetical protein A2X29_05175 [Elusimicrobia bacterium GWA2_64_40]OGR63966.1 MAG: hypothetical protein A2X30_07460 [Elusimicrobia bacterium GWB2_63_16]HAU90204.1 hypothetical protein [Elusimicrobiota bacterium]
MKTYPILLTAALALAGCAGTRPDVRLTSEPSIERAFDIIASVPEGKSLMKFLRKSPVRFEYANTPGLCHKFALKSGQIFMPAGYKGSDLVLALAIARAAQIYRLSAQSGLEEIISEEEELGSLFQARIALEINLVAADFAKAGGAPEIKTDFCTYVLETSRYAMAQARREALTADADCQRPLETLENQRVWLEKTRKAINDETFYQLLYERDQARVKKGSMTSSEAMKRDAAVRALPTYEVYRFQRTFYDDQNEVFKRFARLYAAEVARDAAWRAAHQAEIDRARTEFSDCDMR